jgi:hypothetical protein
MNNLLSYCGLVEAKIRASDIDLPVLMYNKSVRKKGILIKLEFHCDICGKDFAFKRGLRRHIGNVHEVRKGLKK